MHSVASAWLIVHSGSHHYDLCVFTDVQLNGKHMFQITTTRSMTYGAPLSFMLVFERYPRACGLGPPAALILLYGFGAVGAVPSGFGWQIALRAEASDNLPTSFVDASKHNGRRVPEKEPRVSHPNPDSTSNEAVKLSLPFDRTPIPTPLSTITSLYVIILHAPNNPTL
ncbi:hypothetical protein LZ30DRAFT_718262 [Colletotrichum cereale]|nr:hypothetical protein LZ30DRAFT_718262 [Colletotrichum cereale]